MKPNKNEIYRITIDEMLDENLARVLISSLKKEIIVSDLTDINVWNKEESVLFTGTLPKNVKDISNMNFELWSSFLNSLEIDEKQRVSWSDLREGQVYILGKYSVEKQEKQIRIVPGLPTWDKKRRNRLHRFDLVPEMKTKINKLYNEALTRRKVIE